jgi:putative phosphoesterase
MAEPGAMQVAVIADTHLPRGRRRLPSRCVEMIANCEALIHAGDLTTVQVLRDLETIGPPVHAVHGNVDEPALRRALASELRLDFAGHTVAVVHDAGPRRGRLERLRRRFPDAAAVIFGHSHMPEHTTDGDLQIFNPGSPTERRRAPVHTMGIARADGGTLEFDLIELIPYTAS